MMDTERRQREEVGTTSLHQCFVPHTYFLLLQPIHFHLSGHVTGSYVSKNLIRESNQRCIVVHGTHYLNVEGNVAYDTAGHCFMLEDGQEQYNVFRDNLGALTRRVQNLIPDDGSNGEETDDRPSTFWITNPTNSWIGNVAAGSEDNGIWLELRSSIRGPEADMYPDLNPRKAPLTLFESNVAHSNNVRVFSSRGNSLSSV